MYDIMMLVHVCDSFYKRCTHKFVEVSRCMLYKDVVSLLLQQVKSNGKMYSNRALASREGLMKVNCRAILEPLCH